MTEAAQLPIRLLSDRVLVDPRPEHGERRSQTGIVIPATAKTAHRLSWGEVMAIGSTVRNMEVGDRVLYDPEDRAEVEVRGKDYVLLREREVHAVASERVGDSQTGLYL